MNITLEQQLFDLALPLPDEFVPRVVARAATPPAVHQRRSRRGRTLIAGVGAGILFVGANAAAAEYVPAYREFAQVLPFMGSATEDRVKQSAGIPDDGFEVVGAALPADEFVVTVIGTYADAYRTTVLVRVERNPEVETSGGPIPDVAGTSARLIDASGREYRWTGGTGLDDPSGWTNALDFEPLRGAAASGDPVRLVISDLVGGQPGGSAGYTGPLQRYEGNWEFTLSFTQQDAPSLPVPGAPIRSGDTYFTIELIQVTGYHLFVKWSATGGAADRLAEFEAAHPLPWPEGPMGDANGRAVHLLWMSLWPQFVDAGGNWVGGGREGMRGEVIDGVYYGEQEISLPAPGTYLMRFGHFTEEGITWDDVSNPGWPVAVGDPSAMPVPTPTAIVPAAAGADTGSPCLNAIAAEGGEPLPWICFKEWGIPEPAPLPDGYVRFAGGTRQSSILSWSQEASTLRPSLPRSPGWRATASCFPCDGQCRPLGRLPMWRSTSWATTEASPHSVDPKPAMAWPTAVRSCGLSTAPLSRSRCR